MRSTPAINRLTLWTTVVILLLFQVVQSQNEEYPDEILKKAMEKIMNQNNEDNMSNDQQFNEIPDGNMELTPEEFEARLKANFENSTFDDEPYEVARKGDNKGSDKSNQAFKEKNESQDFRIVRVYLLDGDKVELVSCSGIFISQSWIVSSGSCLRDATGDNYLKVCNDVLTISDPGTCKNSTYASRIVFPNHEWYNNLAFIETDGSLNVTAELDFPKEQKRSSWNKEFSKCQIIGLSVRDAFTEVSVKVRKFCRTGYYCVDDASGWGCDMDRGSLLICHNKPKGILVAHYHMSCQHHTDDTYNNQGGEYNHPAQDEGDNEDDPVTEDRYAMHYVISFEAYKDLIIKIREGKYEAGDDGKAKVTNEHEHDDEEKKCT